MKREKILSTISAENFVGKTAELDFILRHAKEEMNVRGLLVLSALALGASELLRQIYDQLFYEQTGKIPFYFRLKKFDKTAENAALRFLQNFLLQAVAFRRNDKKFSTLRRKFAKFRSSRCLRTVIGLTVWSKLVRAKAN